METGMKLTGYPSIDKPWLKYYSEETINAKMPYCTLYEYLYENNKNYKDNYALNYFGKKFTYGEMFEEIDLIAKAFVANGVKPGEVVSIVTLSSVISILCFYALNKIGAISNFVNVLSNEEDLKQCFVDADSKMVITLDLFGDKVLNASKLSGVERIISYSLSEYMPFAVKMGYKSKLKNVEMNFKKDSLVIDWKKFIQKAAGRKNVEYKKNPKDVCFYGHTGGTTGFPKTVLLNDCQMNAVVHQYYLSFTRKRGDSFLYITIPFVIYGVITCMHMPLSLGCCIIIIPKYDPDDWSMYFKKYRPNHIATVPSFVSPMLNDSKLNCIDMSYVKTVAVGGDGMTDALEEQMNDFLNKHNSSCCITKGYGLSEVGATAVTEFDYANKIGSVGIPLPQNNIKILNTETGEDCQYGQVGEICLCCPSKMIGYKDNEEETRNFSQIHKDGAEWIHTGDLGYVDEDGFLFLKGRIKRLILVTVNGAGYKVSPNIPEEIIARHDDVKNACIIGAMSGRDQVLRACVVLEDGYKDREALVEKELREKCEKELAEYLCPTFYDFIYELPLTSAGKVNYRKLEEMMENSIN